jgi:hypothetical protein
MPSGLWVLRLKLESKHWSSPDLMDVLMRWMPPLFWFYKTTLALLMPSGGGIHRISSLVGILLAVKCLSFQIFCGSVYLNATSTLERSFRAVCAVECRPMTVSAGINILRFQMFKLQVIDISNLLDSLRFRLMT